MAHSVSLIVPLGDGHSEQRETHWEWLHARWEALRPEWQIVVGRCRADRWSKATAVADAAERATGDVWVVSDADLWVESWPTLKEAAELATEAPWVVPCANVYRLNSDTTADIVSEDPDQPVHWPVERSHLAPNRNATPYRLTPGGGIFAITPDNYARSGGFDRRFVGWGGEDISFGYAATALLGEPARLEASVWHLWHRPAHPKTQRMCPDNDRLTRRYITARTDPAAMAALTEEHRHGDINQ